MVDGLEDPPPEEPPELGFVVVVLPEPPLPPDDGLFVVLPEDPPEAEPLPVPLLPPLAGFVAGTFWVTV